MKIECEQCKKVFDEEDIVKTLFARLCENKEMYHYYCEECYNAIREQGDY